MSQLSWLGLLLQVAEIFSREVRRMKSLTREEARALDRRAMDEFAVPGIVLMENAGRNMAALLISLGVAHVVVCCGKGNNGGDGLVIARHLDIAGVSVSVLLFADPERLGGDAAVNYQIVRKSGLPFQTMVPLDEAVLRQTLSSADWLVDALFGTGLAGPVGTPLDRVIAAMNESGAKIFAVDIPSGLDANTGQPLGATVRATVTATVVAPKAGFAHPDAARWLGQVEVVGMGAPRGLVG